MKMGQESPAAHVVNPDRLREVAQGDEEFLRELIDLYLSDTPGQVEALARAVADQDPAGAAAAAHKLKSSCGNVGADGLVALCHEVEMLGRASRSDGMADLFERFRREFGQVNEVLASMRPEGG
jgi:HPt (histidine-containing phosphotransfer) domain-containing protein